MWKLLWAERRKLRRSSIVLFTILATVLLAIIVLLGGQSMDGGGSLNDAGWYMTMVQPWATMLVLPAVIAMLGSYMICREEQDDTMKFLHIIPISETKLISAKMMVAFVFSIFIYLLLFAITLSVEAVLHFSDLSAEMVFRFMKMYLLEGVGVFFAISPIIAIVAYMKKSYWLALVLAEVYSFAGLFMSMSSTLKIFYPITAVFGISGYYETTLTDMAGSIISLLVCTSLSVVLLIGLGHREKENF